MNKAIFTFFMACSVVAQSAMADQAITAIPADQAPLVDGKSDESIWAKTPEITTRDAVADIDIRLKAVYTKEKIFFLVSFPDATENRQHKMLLWDKKRKQYRAGPKREDSFVFKWSMEPLPVSLALTSGNPHKADVWYWKAYRTDHAGRADDKLQIMSDLFLPSSQTIIADDGRTYYLRRHGDKGKGAYKQTTPGSYQGDEIVGLKPRTPEGSRADVEAKGVWADGRWTIEFARRLDTGNEDDLALKPGNSYNFGVSRYEIAGRLRNPDIEIPDYGSGDVGEMLTLKFQR